MARAPCTFRQQDLTRALKAARAAGIDVAWFEIEKDGRIVLVMGKPSEARDRNELDEWITKHADQIEEN